MSKQKFIEISKSLFIDPDYRDAFSKLGLISIDAVFYFHKGKDPGGSILPKYRNRLQIEISNPEKILFLKRYDNAGVFIQVKNWFYQRSRKSMMSCELDSAKKLSQAGIKTPKVIAHGEKWGTFFEKRSFIITEEIPDAEALDKRLPDCFYNQSKTFSLKRQRQFIKNLGQFARKFHNTGCRHRDFYLAHIFFSHNDNFYLIDLQRVFKPMLLSERYRVKDIAQLYYSAAGSIFSRTDRLRFYKSYTDKQFLDRYDKVFIKKVIKKAIRMAKHDIRYHRPVPFIN